MRLTKIHRLRTTLENMIFLDYETSQREKLEQRIWNSHQKVISIYRKKIKEVRNTNQIHNCRLTVSVPQSKWQEEARRAQEVGIRIHEHPEVRLEILQELHSTPRMSLPVV